MYQFGKSASEYLAIGIWLQLLISLAAVIYVLHLCRVAMRHHRERGAARLTALHIYLADLRDLSLAMTEAASAPQAERLKGRLSLVRALEATDRVLTLSLAAIPTRRSILAADRAKAAALRLREWVVAQSDQPEDWSDAPAVWRPLAEACNVVHHDVEAWSAPMFGLRPRATRPSDLRFGGDPNAPTGLVSVRDMLAPGEASAPARPAVSVVLGPDPLASEQQLARP